jgi:hypothetical protein
MNIGFNVSQAGSTSAGSGYYYAYLLIKQLAQLDQGVDGTR